MIEQQLKAQLAEQQRIIMMQQHMLQQQQQLVAASSAQAMMPAMVSNHAAVAPMPSFPSALAMPPTLGPPRRQAPAKEHPEPIKEPEVVVEGLECLLDEDTGNVVVSMGGTPIVTATPTGDLFLSTSDWYNEETVIGMNQALKPIDMKIQVTGDPEEAKWKVSDGRTLTRYQEDPNLGYMKIPAKGYASQSRAQAILSFFQGGQSMAAAPAPAVAAAGPGLVGRMQGMGGVAAGYGRPSAAAVQMEADAGVMRRMKAQGRY